HVIRPVYAGFHEHLRQLIAAELSRETGVEGRRVYQTAAALLSMMVGVHAEQRLETERLTRTEYRQMLLDVTRLMLRDLTDPLGDRT
ncbi:MAG: hypothetical protein ACKOPM_05845, partial [Novosphingobium sp.]